MFCAAHSQMSIGSIDIPIRRSVVSSIDDSVPLLVTLSENYGPGLHDISRDFTDPPDPIATSTSPQLLLASANSLTTPSVTVQSQPSALAPQTVFQDLQ